MSEYDGGDDKGLPAWDSQTIELSPTCMDNPTFIEWLERQFETPEETAAREQRREARHKHWHQTSPGIWSCCITWGKIKASE